MNSILPTEILACPFGAFAIICVIWALIITIWLGENLASVIIICGLTFSTSWLWGLYSWMVLVVAGGILLLGLIGFIIYSVWDDIPDPIIAFLDKCVMLVIVLIIFGGIYLILGKELRGQILHWGLIVLGTTCVLE